MLKFGMPGELAFYFQGDKNEAPNNLISMIRLLRKGCHIYLTYVKNVKKEVVDLGQVPVVREFLDVFLEELPGLPSNGEVEFSINVVLGTQPIFIPLYRMAPAKLKELKDQWQNLLLSQPNLGP